MRRQHVRGETTRSGTRRYSSARRRLRSLFHDRLRRRLFRVHRFAMQISTGALLDDVTLCTKEEKTASCIELALANTTLTRTDVLRV